MRLAALRSEPRGSVQRTRLRVLRLPAVIALAAVRLPVGRPAIDRRRLRWEAGAVVITRLALRLLVGLLPVSLLTITLLTVWLLLLVSRPAIVLAVCLPVLILRLAAIPRLAITGRLLRWLAARDQRPARRDVAAHDDRGAAHALGLDHVVQHRGIGRRQPHAAVRHRHAEMRRVGEAVDGVTVQVEEDRMRHRR